MRYPTAVIAGLTAALALVGPRPMTAEDVTLKTTFALLVGRPSAPAGGIPNVQIEPGTVIVPGPQSSGAARVAYNDIIRKLLPTYRLDSLTIEKREVLDLVRGREQRVELPVADVGVTITLLDVQPDTALYEATLSRGGKIIAQPRVMVLRGQWATMGSRDGEAAPYLFMLIGPWTREDEAIARRQADLVPPRLLEKVAPTYPEAARKARLQGMVVLRGTIGVDGRVGDVTVVESAGPELDDAAIKAFAQWRFEPGRNQKGTAVPFDYTVTLNFKLH
ncbi:MAG: energy transducer TonB [Acidobacteriota bacterium]